MNVDWIKVAPRMEVMSSPSNPAALKHMVPMPISYVPQLLTGLTS